MTDKTEAMDNLIAQDADLIETCPDDLVKELRHIHRDGTWSAKKPDAPHPLCAKAADRIEAQAAEIERLNKSAECLAESRRLAVKDIAELEAEIGQWKVDYDCAIMDVEQLREWVTALEVLLDCAVADYCDQIGRPKDDLHWVNQSAHLKEQRK